MAQEGQLTTEELAFIDRQRVAHLASADTEGNPSLVPICFAYEAPYFYTPLDEKPKSVAVDRLRRVRNILARPEVMLLFDQYRDDWSQLGYIQIRGRAELIDPQDPQHVRAIALLRQRYPQYRDMYLEQLPCIRITPLRRHRWGPLFAQQ